MNFKEALIAHLQGEKVEASYKGAQEWMPFIKWHGLIPMDKIDDPDFAGAVAYRLAPRTIFVNGVEVPAPEKDFPEYGVEMWHIDFSSDVLASWFTYDGTDVYSDMLERGVLYLNKEDAIARAKAMLLTSDK